MVPLNSLYHLGGISTCEKESHTLRTKAEVSEVLRHNKETEHFTGVEKSQPLWAAWKQYLGPVKASIGVC